MEELSPHSRTKQEENIFEEEAFVPYIWSNMMQLILNKMGKNQKEQWAL